MSLSEAPVLPEDAGERLNELVAAVAQLEERLESLETDSLVEVAQAIQLCDATTQAMRDTASSIRAASVDAIRDLQELVEDNLIPAVAAVTAAAREGTEAVNDLSETLKPFVGTIDTATAELDQEIEKREQQLTDAAESLRDHAEDVFDEAGSLADAAKAATEETERRAEEAESRIVSELTAHATGLVDAGTQQFVQPTLEMLDQLRSELQQIEAQLRQVIRSCGDEFCAQVTQFVDTQLAGVYAEIDSMAARLEQRLGLEASNQSSATGGSRSSSDMLDSIFRETMGKLPIVKDIGSIVGLPV